MALIQTTVDDSVKARADKVLERYDLTTPMAVKMVITQVANKGRSPSDGIHFREAADEELTDNARRDMVLDMVLAEAQEYGIVPDDSTTSSDVPAAILAELGIRPSEVGQ